jgi:hypothetical protein
LREVRGTIGVDAGKNGLLVLLVRANTRGIPEIAQVRTPCTGNDALVGGGTEESKDSPGLLLVR